MLTTSQNYWYSRFPESLFPCVDEKYIKDYRLNVCEGFAAMKESTCFIVGICRNIESNLPRFLARIHHLASYFTDYHIFLYENDSTDNTKSILKSLHSHGYSRLNIFVVSENFDSPEFIQNKSYVRRKYMAAARNMYMEYLEDCHIPFEYTIVLDTDVAGGFSYEGILNSFGHISRQEDIAGIVSNGVIYQDNRRLMYDTWAYRELNDLRTDTEKNLLRFNRGEPLYELASGFGGLAIYKTRDLHKLRYDSEDCDHVTLHKKLIEKTGRKIYLNPSQVVLYNNHQYC